jgi:hypothetical protein
MMSNVDQVVFVVNLNAGYRPSGAGIIDGLDIYSHRVSRYRKTQPLKKVAPAQRTPD